MEKNITIKEYMEFSGYKTAGIDFDITSLDPECIFIGDIYVVKYKKKCDNFASFEEQTYLDLKTKNAILLRIGYERYINLLNIRTLGDLERVKRKLKSKLKSSSVTIIGNFFKPYAGDQVVLNVKPYEKENQDNKNNQKGKGYKKILFK